MTARDVDDSRVLVTVAARKSRKALATDAELEEAPNTRILANGEVPSWVSTADGLDEALDRAGGDDFVSLTRGPDGFVGHVRVIRLADYPELAEMIERWSRGARIPGRRTILATDASTRTVHVIWALGSRANAIGEA